MLYQLSYASLLEIPNLSPRSPESSRRTGQSSKDITTELGVQHTPTHFRIFAVGTENNLKTPPIQSTNQSENEAKGLTDTARRNV